MIDYAKCNEFAKTQLKGRYKIPVIAVLLAELLGFIQLFIQSRFFPTPTQDELIKFLTNPGSNQEMILDYTKNTLSSLGISIIFGLIGFIFTFAATGLYLKMSKSPEPVELKDYVDGFAKWKRGILCGLWIALWTFLWCLPFTIAMVICLFISSTAILFGLVILIGACIFLIYKLLNYSFTYYVAAEYDNVSIPRAMELSITLVNGSKKQIVLIALSTLALPIAGVVVLGLIFSFSGTAHSDVILQVIQTALLCLFAPIYNLSTINLYHSQLKDKVEAGSLRLEDLQ